MGNEISPQELGILASLVQ